MDITKCDYLLRSVKTVLKHQKEKEILKGEKFNIFSILKMETKENATHSAFLAELLNPRGSHLRKDIFLRLFIDVIFPRKTDEDPWLDTSSATVKIEHHIGKKNVINKTGGRIDIYIKDGNGRCLSIENKIHAIDQEAQIERYCQYKKGQNRVLYLTLSGSTPPEESRGLLKENEDYYNISYRKHIVEWLTLCMKETHDYTMLRETIKQYSLLIKKLTHTMNNEQENELFNLILNNYDEAMYLAANVNKALAKFKGDIRQSVVNKLKERLGDRYRVLMGSSIESAYSQIWIKIDGKQEEKLFFGIQSFAVSKDAVFNSLFVGIFVFKGNYQPQYVTLGEKRSNWWIQSHHFTPFMEHDIDLNNKKTLRRLFTSKDFYNGFIDHIVKETIEYLQVNHDRVVKFLEKYE